VVFSDGKTSSGATSCKSARLLWQRTTGLYMLSLPLFSHFLHECQCVTLPTVYSIPIYSFESHGMPRHQQRYKRVHIGGLFKVGINACLQSPLSIMAQCKRDSLNSEFNPNLYHSGGKDNLALHRTPRHRSSGSPRSRNTSFFFGEAQHDFIIFPADRPLSTCIHRWRKRPSLVPSEVHANVAESIF
jgi:hypothetical protein